MLDKSGVIKRMNLLRRVGIRIRRERRKAMILTVAFWAISLLVLSGTAFSSGVKTSLKELREQFFACLTIEQTISGASSITPALTEAVVTATAPEGWTGSNVCYLSMENISLVPGRFTREGDEAASIAKLISCGDSSLIREFSGKSLRLTEGRHLTAEDDQRVIISEALAEMNGLSIGDKLRGVVTDHTVMSAKQGIGTEYEYEIIGMFAIEENRPSSGDRAEGEMYENYMFVDEQSGFEILENIRLKERQYVNGLTLWAADPAELSGMYEAIIALPGYDWENYYINTNSAEYDRSAEPMMRMERIISIFMLLVVVISALILVVLLTMWNHERTREMAILLSIGCSKGNILVQLFVENLVLFVAGYALAIPVVGLMTALFNRVIDYGEIGISVRVCAPAGVTGCVLVASVTLLSSLNILRKSPKELLTVQ